MTIADEVSDAFWRERMPAHLADMDGWIHIDGLGWLFEWHHEPADDLPGPFDFWWWHDCSAMVNTPAWRALRTIDVSSGQRHEIIGGSLHGHDLTIHGGSGSIPCTECGLHGWVRNGRWVRA